MSAAGAVHVFATVVMVQPHTRMVHALSAYKTVRTSTLQVVNGAAAPNTTDCCVHSKRRNDVSVEIQTTVLSAGTCAMTFRKCTVYAPPDPSNV